MSTAAVTDLQQLRHTVENVLGSIDAADFGAACAFIARLDQQMLGRYCGSLGDKLSNTLPTLVAAGMADDSPNAVHLEIGTLFGGSLVGKLWALNRAGRTQQRVVAIDPLDGYYGERIDPWSGLAITAENVKINIERFDFNPVDVQLITRLSTDPACLDELGDVTVQTLLIDGDHSYEGAKADWQIYSPLVAPGGYVILDDFGNRAWPEVTRFGQELIDATPAGWQVRGAIDTGLILQRQS